MSDRADNISRREFTWQGCFIVLLFFVSNLMWGGLFKTMGVLLPTLKEQFATYTWVIGILVSLMGCGSSAVALFIRCLQNKFGCRKLLIACSFGMTGGLLLIAVAANSIEIALLMIALVGPCCGILANLSFILTSRHFNKHFGMACGIAHTGGAISLLVFAPLTQLFLDTYGWRGAMLLIAAICCHSIPCAALIKDSKEEYESVTDKDVNEQPDTGHRRSVKAFIVNLYQEFDPGILFQFRYWVLFCCRFGVSFSNSSWLIYYVPHLESRGFSPQVAASLCSAATVGFLFGTFFWSPFIDRGYVRCSTCVIISSLMLSASFVVDPWVNTVLGYALVTVVCGFSISAVYTTTDILIKDFYELSRLPNVVGWLKLKLITVIFLAGLVPGWMYDSTGSYDVAFIIIGCVPIAGMLPLVVGLILKMV